MIFWTMIQGFILFFTFVAAIQRTGCNEGPNHDHYCPTKGSVAVLWISLLFLFFWWCIQAIIFAMCSYFQFRSLTLSSRMRRLVLFTGQPSVQMATYTTTTTTTTNPQIVTQYPTVYIQSQQVYAPGYGQTTTQYVQPTYTQYPTPQYPPQGYPQNAYHPTQVYKYDYFIVVLIL
jgi:hypothetical protein